MSWLSQYIKSSIGAKHIMAISGLMLVGFLIAHMAGNLQVFAGPEAINGYAEKLQSLGPLLWVARAGLVIIFGTHILSAVRLYMMNNAARPVKYKMVKSEKSSFASRTMAMGGIIVVLFLIFHLVHFTLGGGPMAAEFNQLDQYGRHDVYKMVVLGFQNPIISIAYLISITALCLHLSHGVTSLFQSLGFDHPRFNGMFKMAGPAIALIIFVGNCAMPIACLAGWIKVAS